MKPWEKYLGEATVSGTYPSDGTGISGDDDLPTGTTVFGDKMVRKEVKNRLTGSHPVYEPETQKWSYDEFEHSKGMEDKDNYSTTLDGLKKLLGDRLWAHIKPKDDNKLQRDKERLKPLDKKNRLGDEPEETAEIVEKIDMYLSEAELTSTEKRNISRAVIGDKSMKVKVKDIGVDLKIIDLPDGTKFEYQENVDMTIALVDIADTLRYEFEESTKNGRTTFIMRES